MCHSHVSWKVVPSGVSAKLDPAALGAKLLVFVEITLNQKSA